MRVAEEKESKAPPSARPLPGKVNLSWQEERAPQESEKHRNCMLGASSLQALASRCILFYSVSALYAPRILVRNLPISSCPRLAIFGCMASWSKSEREGGFFLILLFQPFSPPAGTVERGG